MEQRRHPHEALLKPIPWRPALQLTDVSYTLPKELVRLLVLTAHATPHDPRRVD